MKWRFAISSTIPNCKTSIRFSRFIKFLFIKSQSKFIYWLMSARYCWTIWRLIRKAYFLWKNLSLRKTNKQKINNRKTWVHKCSFFSIGQSGFFFFFFYFLAEKWPERIKLFSLRTCVFNFSWQKMCSVQKFHIGENYILIREKYFFPQH